MLDLLLIMVIERNEECSGLLCDGLFSHNLVIFRNYCTVNLLVTKYLFYLMQGRLVLLILNNIADLLIL